MQNLDQTRGSAVAEEPRNLPCQCVNVEILSAQGRIWSKQGPVQKNVGPSLTYEHHPTEFTRQAQWQCCHHRHFVKDSHNIIIYAHRTEGVE